MGVVWHLFCSSQDNMLLHFVLLFFLSDITVKSQITRWTTTYVISLETNRTTVATTANETVNPSLQLVATPDYPVAAGQRVDLHCSGFTMPDSVMSWQHLKNKTWQEVGIGRELALTRPEQSGLYRCRAENLLSQNHTVYIISMPPPVLGIAAFGLSLLALIIVFAILLWLSCQRPGATPTTSSAATKGFPGSEKSPKGGLPQTQSDGEVYINYTNTSQFYSDLDPTSMTDDNVYSSLS